MQTFAALRWAFLKGYLSTVISQSLACEEIGRRQGPKPALPPEISLQKRTFLDAFSGCDVYVKQSFPQNCQFRFLPRLTIAYGYGEQQCGCLLVGGNTTLEVKNERGKVDESDPLFRHGRWNKAVLPRLWQTVVPVCDVRRQRRSSVLRVLREQGARRRELDGRTSPARCRNWASHQRRGRLGFRGKGRGLSEYPSIFSIHELMREHFGEYCA